MNPSDEHYLTTRELADLLRIKERKVYDMATRGEVPCVRVVGKLLFPREQISRWIDAARSGPAVSADAPIPPTFLGSHDPLLDWALRESNSGLAAFFDGSADGLNRFGQREGVACAVHVHEDGQWNVNTVKNQLGGRPVVLVEFAKRSRGIIVPMGNPLGLSTIAGLASHRIAQRQMGAASQQLFEQLLNDAEVELTALKICADCARTEDELGMQVFDDKVDAAFGLESVARRLRLGFVPLLEERFDLLVWRQAWFDQPFQQLLTFTKGQVFQAKAASLGGYDVSQIGQVHYNGV